MSDSWSSHQAIVFVGAHSSKLDDDPKLDIHQLGYIKIEEINSVNFDDAESKIEAPIISLDT